MKPEFENILPIEQLALLYKQSFAAFAATIAALVYILFWIHDLVDGYYLAFWTNAIVALNIYLLTWVYFVRRATIKTRITTEKAKHYIFIYQIQAVLHGSSWGGITFPAY